MKNNFSWWNSEGAERTGVSTRIIASGWKEPRKTAFSHWSSIWGILKWVSSSSRNTPHWSDLASGLQLKLQHLIQHADQLILAGFFTGLPGSACTSLRMKPSCKQTITNVTPKANFTLPLYLVQEWNNERSPCYPHFYTTLVFSP